MNIERLDNLWRDRWAEFDNREIWEWIYDEIIELPPCYAVRGRFDASVVPFTKPVFRALRSPTVRRVFARSSIQSLKTLIGEFWLLWLIDNSPGPTQWLQTTDQDAKEHAETRFNLLVQCCDRIKRYYTGIAKDEKTVAIIFQHMSLLMQGAFTKKNVQRKSVRNQMCSEVWQVKYWPPGRLGEATTRLTQFEQTCKQYIESQPGEEDDDGDKAWKLTTMGTWHWQCQGHCRKLQIPVWSGKRDDGSLFGMVWEKSERTRRKRSNGEWGEWIWHAVYPTIRYVCKYCGDSVPDDPRVRRLLNDEGKYVLLNQNAQPGVEGFSWNQLTVAALSWSSQFNKFQAALDDMERGLNAKMIEFNQKVLALNASQDFGRKEITPAIEVYEVVIGGPEVGWVRFMTVDCQADLGLFYWVIRDWSKDGRQARRVARGMAPSFDALRALQKKYGVVDHRTFLDCAYESRRVWAACVRFGHWGHVLNSQGQKEKVFLSWFGLWGRDSHSFLWVEKDAKGDEVESHRLYSPIRFGDPALGKGAAAQKGPYFNWSNEQVKDALLLYRNGKCEGFKWVNPPPEKGDEEAEAEYIRQINSEDKRHRFSKLKRRYEFRWGQIAEDRPNHYWDCECMQVVAAAIVGILTPPSPPDTVTDGTKEPAEV